MASKFDKSEFEKSDWGFIGVAGLLLASYVVFATIGNNQTAEEKEKEAAIQRSNERGTLQITINGVPLRVPVEFVAPSERFFEGEVGRFDLALNWPELTPKYLVIQPIYVDIREKGPSIPFNIRMVEEWHADLQGGFGPFGLSGHPVNEGYAESFPGLKVYSVALDSGGQLIIHCQEGVCASLDQNTFEEVDVYFRFFKENVESWRIIHDHVTGLVSSFLEEV